MTPTQPLLPATPQLAGRDMFALYDSKRDHTIKSFRSACYAPFLTLDFFTTGQVQVCCENDSFPVGNVQTDALIEIWRGPAIQRLRDALMRYDFSLGCQGCEWTIQRGGRPFAMNYDTHPVETLTAWPRVMQFRLSNVCNFACIMCSGLLSSTIRRDREHQPPLPRMYTDRFFHELWEFLPHLDSAVFAGGEPLLTQENFRIWDHLLETRNERTCISITSNASVWSERLSEYFQRLNIAHVTASMDGATKETFERVRIGSSFETVTANLRRIAEATSQIRPRGRFGTRAAQFSFSYCLMPVNAHEMPDVFLMAEDFGADVFVNVVTTPKECSFLGVQPIETEQAAQHLQQAYDRLQPRLSPLNQTRYLEALGVLRTMAEGELQELSHASRV